MVFLLIAILLFVVTVGTSSLVPSCLGSPCAFVAALFPFRFAPVRPLYVFLMDLSMFCMRLCFPFINLLLYHSFQGSAGYLFVYILFGGFYVSQQFRSYRDFSTTTATTTKTTARGHPKRVFEAHMRTVSCLKRVAKNRSGTAPLRKQISDNYRLGKIARN